MVGTVTRTRHTIVRAAKRGAATVKAAAGEAIGAAAKAATEVVLEKTNAALAAGRAKLTRSSPAIKRAAEKTARRSLDKPAQQKAGRQEASEYCAPQQASDRPPTQEGQTQFALITVSAVR